VSHNEVRTKNSGPETVALSDLVVTKSMMEAAAIFNFLQNDNHLTMGHFNGGVEGKGGRGVISNGVVSLNKFL